ncbi:hypothetical protein Tco_1311630 [Tanacetum coccineum]
MEKPCLKSLLVDRTEIRINFLEVTSGCLGINLDMESLRTIKKTGKAMWTFKLRRVVCLLVHRLGNGVGYTTFALTWSSFILHTSFTLVSKAAHLEDSFYGESGVHLFEE